MIQVAVLNQKLEDLNELSLNLDIAIGKLSEVNTTVSRMLTVHEERLSKQEEIDTAILQRLTTQIKCISDHDSVTGKD